MLRQAFSRPSLNGPLRSASACGAICRAADRAASRAAASRASASGSLSLRDSSALRLFSRLSRKLTILRIAGCPEGDIIRVETMAGVRMDKWLWAARFFKTRSIAARACGLGRIQFHGQPVKASREVRIGDMLQVKKDSGDFQIEVLALSEVRGPAPVAQALY